jgi:branched-chain amino acid transport system ATP-binding protein
VADAGVTEAERAGRPLVLHAVSKRFGGVAAVSGVSMECRPDEIVGLIGPNGAGKTTLLSLISGTFRPDAGEIRLGQRRLELSGPRECARIGISRTFQNIRLFGRLTVRQNVEVSAAVRRRHRPTAPGLPVDALLERFQLAAVAEQKAVTLPYGLQRRTEIARALALSPSFLLLDEPAAGMNEAESAQLVDELRDAHELAGCGLLVIDHDLSFILTLCQRIYVLDKGELIAEGSPEDIQEDERVRAVYLGRRRTAGDGTVAADMSSARSQPIATERGMQ